MGIKNNKEEKIRVLVIVSKCDEPNECYRLDDDESAIHCFRNLFNNFDHLEKHEFYVEDMTAEKWAECERIGEEMA